MPFSSMLLEYNLDYNCLSYSFLGFNSGRPCRFLCKILTCLSVKVFEPFGPLYEVWMARSVPCFAFVVFRYLIISKEISKFQIINVGKKTFCVDKEIVDNNRQASNVKSVGTEFDRSNWDFIGARTVYYVCFNILFSCLGKKTTRTKLARLSMARRFVEGQ